MNISWGTKIAILYIAFALLIISLVVATCFQKTDLVANDYYQQETVYQQRINATQASAALGEQIKLDTVGSNIGLHFPKAFLNKSLVGNIHFYAVADAASDRNFPIQTTNSTCSIDRSKLAKALYEVQVSWAVSGKDYYQSIPLNLR